MQTGPYNQFDSWAMFDYICGEGFLGSRPMPIMAGLWNDSGALKVLAVSGAGTVGFSFFTGAVTNGLVGLVWNATADNTDAWVQTFSMPNDFKRDGGAAGRHTGLILRFPIRKLDTTGGAAENATLQMKADIAFHSPSISDSGVESDGETAFNQVTGIVAKTMADWIAGTAAASCFVPAKAVAAAEEAFRYMYVDVTAALSAAQLASLRAGAKVTIQLYPSAAVGTALALEVGEPELLYSRHFQPENKHLRGLAWHA